MFTRIENNSSFNEVILNGNQRIGTIRIYKNTFINLKNLEINVLHPLRRKLFIRKNLYKRITRV